MSTSMNDDMVKPPILGSRRGYSSVECVSEGALFAMKS